MTHTRARKLTWFTGALAATACIAMNLFAPASAQPARAAEACVPTGGTLSWGVKESFRSYISGSIAKGSWETTDGAGYETPNFSWSSPSGALDATSGAGDVSFMGTVQFSGHNGLLNTNMSNPTISFAGDGTATLLLDVYSTDTAGEAAVDVQQTPFASVTVPTPLPMGETELTVAGAPATLTAEGAEAFAGFYAEGEALDPVTVSLTFENCGVEAEPEPEPSTESPEVPTATDVVPQEEGSEFPWVIVAIAGVALLAIVVTSALLIANRRRDGATAESAGAEAEGEGEAAPDGSDGSDDSEDADEPPPSA